MTDSTLLPLCPACRKGRLHAIIRTEVFRPNGNEVKVELLASRCDACGVETTRASQHDENLRRLAARKVHYGRLLMGEEIVALRKRYGLTQQAASRIFGKGKIAFSRYENEVTYPDEGATLMLAMAIEKPDSLKWLADKAGVEIPLWRERCEDGRLSLRVVPGQQVRLAMKERLDYHTPDGETAAVKDGWRELHGAGRKPAETFKVRIVPAREAA
jgi:putative zinc finger/helix-turn-helix YgiT family protein